MYFYSDDDDKEIFHFITDFMIKYEICSKQQISEKKNCCQAFHPEMEFKEFEPRFNLPKSGLN